MPRKIIPVDYKIEYLSVLNELGELDATLEPEIPPEKLIKLHRTLLLARKLDERMLALQRQGRIGTFPPAKGQEAAHLGAAAVLSESDWMVPSFRELAAYLWRGASLESILISNNGFNEGAPLKPGSRTLPTAIPVGSQVPHAVGLAWAAKYPS